MPQLSHSLFAFDLYQNPTTVGPFDVASVRFAVSTVVVESIKTGPLTPYRFRALGTAEMAHGNTLA
jgi:hypothetical protein